YFANRMLTTLSNVFTNLNLTDMETGYKVFRREVVEAITPTLKQKRLGIEPGITAKVAGRNYRIYETAISYSGRTYSEGKKIGWRDRPKARLVHRAPRHRRLTRRSGGTADLGAARLAAPTQRNQCNLV